MGTFLLKFLEWMSDTINLVTKYALTVLMAAMTAIIALQVFYRYVLNQPLTWSEEIARYLMIWITFLGSAMAVKYSEHIGVTFILERFPLRVRNGIGVTLNIAVVVFFAMTAWQGAALTLRVVPQQAPATWISMAWAYSSIPVGCGFMLVHALVNLFRKPWDTGAGSGSEDTCLTYD